MLTFNSIDVESAYADRASICQIGVVHVRDAQIEDRWQTSVKPGADRMGLAQPINEVQLV